MRHLRAFVVLFAIAAVVIGGVWLWRTESPASMPVFLKRIVGVPPEEGEPRGRDESITAPDDPALARRTPGPPLYKWRDDKGVWNITDTAPAGRPYERVEVDPDQNVVPTVIPGETEPYREPETDD